MLFVFDNLDPNPTWGAGITLKSVSGTTTKAIRCSLCYSFLLVVFNFVLIVNLVSFSFGVFLNVVDERSTRNRSKTIRQ